jgi:nuclear transport factor 2 (NTF2) superfamily protein
MAEVSMAFAIGPFTGDTARAKTQEVEDAWNSRDPERVAATCTEDAKWRNRVELIDGHEQIVAFLRRKWLKELDYRIRMDLWCWGGDRIAVNFRYEWRAEGGQWFRSYGNELWEFAGNGLIKRRFAGVNDLEIEKDERQIL